MPDSSPCQYCSEEVCNQCGEHITPDHNHPIHYRRYYPYSDDYSYNQDEMDCGPCPSCCALIDNLNREKKTAKFNAKLSRINDELRQMPTLSVDEHSANDPNCRCLGHSILRKKRETYYGINLGVSIRDYSYKPDWEFYTTLKDGYNPPYYLGVELETDNYYKNGIDVGGNTESDIEPSEAATLARPDDFWTPKYDSSVTGPEFVSHPATLNYWREIRPSLQTMFRALLHAGYRSHDNNKCGMHINITPSAFQSGDHLYKMLTLLHFDIKWSLIMSQRSVGRMSDYYSGAELSDRQRRKKVSNEAYNYGHVPTLNKHSLMSFPDGDRFEFRLPRGTLRIDRFYKNLEWTVAMIEYTRGAKLRDCRPTKFMEWVHKHWIKYPALAAYLTERFNNTPSKKLEVSV